MYVVYYIPRHSITLHPYPPSPSCARSVPVPCSIHPFYPRPAREEGKRREQKRWDEMSFFVMLFYAAWKGKETFIDLSRSRRGALGFSVWGVAIHPIPFNSIQFSQITRSIDRVIRRIRNINININIACHCGIKRASEREKAEGKRAGEVRVECEGI